ncbi:MAG: nucleotidyl transferase AbiEii/AbiGii toxin family protein [Acidobacteriota bacterium]
MSPDVAASIRARLLNQAKAKGEEFELTLTRFAAERLLYRLGESKARNRCILKGASLLSVWLSDPYRATRDMDVLASGPADEEAIRSLVTEICAVPCPEDGIRFDLSNLVVETIRPNEEYKGKSARFRASLGSARISVKLDVGFGDALVTGPEEIVYPTLLEGLPPPRLRAYPREAAVAEKFEAMVKLGTNNSRMKDFHDIWALAGAFAFDGPLLRQAVSACFGRRETPWTVGTPPVLTTAFYQGPELETRWRNYLKAGTVLVSPPAQFEVIGERIAQFLGPVRESIVLGTSFERTWLPGGPWELSPIAQEGKL